MRKRVDKFTCDLCKAVAEVSENSVPLKWVVFVVASDPCATSKEPDKEAHVCPGCAKRVTDLSLKF